MPDHTVKTTCPYCGVGCGVLARSEGGAHATIAGDPEHPANFGRLCSKGSALGETLGTESRLLHPMVDGQRVAWNTALDVVAQRFSEIVAAHGPDAVAFYVSGQLLTEDYYVANKLMKGFIGSANIDTNSRLCMASSVAGHRRAFGADVVPGCYEDLDEADQVILVGSNLAWCHPVLYQRLMKARAERGTRIVVIDPRRTATCSDIDLHLAIRPGTDVALFNGLLAEIVRRGAHQADFILAYTDDFESAAEVAMLSAPSIEAVAEACDVPIGDLQAFYDWFVTTERTVTVYSQGVNQSSAGTDKVNAIINAHLATGRIGRPGMGPFSVTGQPNAMGGREVGGLANQLAAHMSFDDVADVDRVARFWGASNIARTSGLKAVDMFRAVDEGRIQAIWIMATNPAVSLPDGNSVRRALAKCPFVVVSDCEASTDTTQFARVLLPAAAWGEKDGTVTNSERRISRQRPFLTSPGEARADWWMVTEVARRMGFAGAFPYESPADVFREHAALSAFENAGTRAFDIGACADMSDDAYQAFEPFQWPWRRGGDQGCPRLFADGGFFTKNRRAAFVPTPPRLPSLGIGETYPLVLNTGRLRDQWHTMTRTGKSPGLASHSPEPFVDIHPADAARFALRDGGLARIATPWGSALLRVRLSDAQRPGELFMPMHWSDANAADAAVGRLANPATDPLSGQPELKHAPARIAAYLPQWQGYLISRNLAAPEHTSYWARLTVPGGHVVELAGDVLPDNMDGWARRLMATRHGDGIVAFADSARGIHRWARLSEGQLGACLFVAPADSSAHALPPRAWLIDLLTRKALSQETRDSLLIGRTAFGAADAGPTVCACFGVGLRTLTAAIENEAAMTVEAIGRTLRAGTNCGSCLSELRELIAAHKPTAAASNAA
jgi:assimilatory nitrate reductase catalytic subunit